LFSLPSVLCLPISLARRPLSRRSSDEAGSSTRSRPTSDLCSSNPQFQNSRIRNLPLSSFPCKHHTKNLKKYHKIKFQGPIVMSSRQKVGKRPFPSFRRIPDRGPGQAPESSLFTDLQNTWTPVTLSRRKPGTGVTTFYEAVNCRCTPDPNSSTAQRRLHCGCDGWKPIIR